MAIIRKAYPTDAYSIVHIMLEVWKNEYNDILPANIVNNMGQDIDNKVRHLKDQIKENNRIFVAIDKDKIVGYIFYAKSNNEIYSSSAEIRSLYILNDYQGKGIGSELLDKAIVEIKKLGIKSMILSCPVKNKNIGFFIKSGGEIKGVNSIEINNCLVECNIIFFDLLDDNSLDSLRWQKLYTKLVDVSLSISTDRGNLALIESNGKIYLGLDVLEMVSALEVAISNMNMDLEYKIDKILIINMYNELVIPNDRDLVLLMNCENADALVLVDVLEMKVKKVSELIV